MNLSSREPVSSPLGDSHLRLGELIQSVRAACGAVPLVAGGATALATALGEARALEAAMLAHFREEEAEGYLSDALEVAPHLAHQAELLERQHATLNAALTELLALLAEPPGGGAGNLAARMAEFLDQLSAHEAAEGALLELAFTDDLGNKD